MVVMPVQVLPPAGRQVVEDGDLVAGGEQVVGEMRADESGASGDYGVHVRGLPYC